MWEFYSSNHFHSKASIGVGPIGSNLVSLSGGTFLLRCQTQREDLACALEYRSKGWTGISTDSFSLLKLGYWCDFYKVYSMAGAAADKFAFFLACASLTVIGWVSFKVGAGIMKKYVCELCTGCLLVSALYFCKGFALIHVESNSCEKSVLLSM